MSEGGKEGRRGVERPSGGFTPRVLRRESAGPDEEVERLAGRRRGGTSPLPVTAARADTCGGVDASPERAEVLAGTPGRYSLHFHTRLKKKKHPQLRVAFTSPRRAARALTPCGLEARRRGNRGALK